MSQKTVIQDTVPPSPTEVTNFFAIRTNDNFSRETLNYAVNTYLVTYFEVIT
jgi:hypothetical protein